jgi:hypothetical protein
MKSSIRNTHALQLFDLVFIGAFLGSVGRSIRQTITEMGVPLRNTAANDAGTALTDAPSAG